MTRARVLAVLFGAVALTLLVPNPAGAAESIGACIVEVIEENGGPEGVEAIVEAGEAEAEGEAHDALIELEDEMEAGCIEAPSLIIPEINEIIWGGLAFLVLLGLMIWKGFPLVRKTMEDRSEKIRTDLQAAQAARAEAEELKRQLEADLAESKANANRVLDQARQEAVVLGANLQVKAEADIAEMKQRAAADVAAARARALADLQSEVAEIVVGAAGKVVERNLDVNTHRQLIDDYIASVGRN